MEQRIEKFEEILEKDLKEELDKIIDAGTISHDDIRTVKDAVKLMLKIQKYKEWMRSGNEHSNDNYKYGSATTGRYVSRDPYSGYGGHGHMIDKLERMYDEASNEHDRYMIREWIKSMENGR